MAAITDFYILSLHVNFPEGGFTERYHMDDGNFADPSQAKLDAKKLISCRADILSSRFIIAFASLSRFCVFKDSYLPTSYRYKPINLATETLITDVEACNDPEVGPLIRFDTASGKFGNRCIRGLRDSWITDNAAATTTFTTYSRAQMTAYTGATAATTTQLEALSRYINAVLRYTQYVAIASKTAFVNGLRAMTGTGTSWATFQYRKLSSHDTGQRYGQGRGRQAAWA